MAMKKIINSEGISMLYEHSKDDPVITNDGKNQNYLKADSIVCKLVDGAISFVFCFHNVDVITFSADHKIDWKGGEKLQVDHLKVFLPVEVQKIDKEGKPIEEPKKEEPSRIIQLNPGSKLIQ